ncbi:Phosphate regulon transcriptional regulatory protein PhoB [Sesbania bispinosa]|nr:Phosphate regulon transcriptional regulatory protein PhoB [Sesbania bispinosa]
MTAFVTPLWCAHEEEEGHRDLVVMDLMGVERRWLDWTWEVRLGEVGTIEELKEILNGRRDKIGWRLLVMGRGLWEVSCGLVGHGLIGWKVGDEDQGVKR